VFRRHWRELAFWRWWWTNQAPVALRVGLGVFLLGAVLVGGLLAADHLSTAKGGTEVTALERTYVETVDKVVTVREKGRIVRKVVPVVHIRKVKVLSKPQTVLETQTSFRTLEITTKGQVRTIRQKVIRRVPVVKTHLVTISGKTQTVSVTQYRPTTAIETRSQTVTNSVTNQVTNSQTVTNSKTVTNTNTETDVVTTVQTHTETDLNTVTETDVTTVTQPITVEVTVPVTVTVTTTASSGP
jgi:hypothetical protein